MSRAVKILLFVWMEAVIFAAFTFLPPVPGFRVPALAKIMIFHVPNAMTATILSIVSAFYAVKVLIGHNPRDDAKSAAAASIAMLFWLLTTVTGMVFARIQWGMAWNWDPKQSSIFILLLIYLAYFSLRAAFTDVQKRAKAAAAWIIFAALTSPLLTYVLPNGPGVQSLHPRGVVFSVDGMGPDYRLIFWSACFGFLGMAIWLFRIHVRIDEMRLKGELSGLSGGLS